MSRNLLHMTKLQDFKDWLTKNGIEHRQPPDTAEYQLLQVKMSKGGYASVYDRDCAQEHLTTDRRIDYLVIKFIKDSKKAVDTEPPAVV